MAKQAALRELEAEDIEDIRQRLKEFVRPFQEVLVREEQRRHLAAYVEGRLLPLQRRTGEPIATQSGVKARPLQHFVGQGKWADEAVREVMADLIAEKMGSRRGVLILDASGIQKYGDDSVGVQRQWCGRLGKEERCQVGEFLAYASQGSVALVDARLYLPKGWAEDAQRRDKCQVPAEVEFRTGWQLALEMVKGLGQRVPHAWVVGDDSYGRPCALRDGLHEAGERYVLEVPGKAKVRRVRGGGWTTAKGWADSLPAGAWAAYSGDGEHPFQLKPPTRCATSFTPPPVPENSRSSRTWPQEHRTRGCAREATRAGVHCVRGAHSTCSGDAHAGRACPA
ncbi:IS701 family transposase [Pyxidicoccus xibeiensis]|uniref:IS701 family transposase n=1 Tax=Pyxidicoccus xibeiensis TaxID=2906759 RepID=UPI0020A700CE|nr:IS701 family transposase [Pyxidicoccus xibeiensis]MCP3143604.1 IS701 family transposase [Pyxidicoccus xibeiensis]